ncbi:MAG: ferritin-like domain-containing protein [Gammaproteobacteria bacterium]|nr:ferritin-like domain-containing protein [Gammaproteobacteria bacterium]
MTAAAEATAPACRWRSLQHAAAHCLALRDPGEKVATTRAAAAQFFSGGLPLADESNWPAIPDPAVVGRPDRPLLVPPRQLAARGLGSDEGRAAFLHAIAHIEFNAINLAWDAVLRFPGMPADYYADWVSCADDEARHHLMLVGRLADFGHAYGDFDAHDGLWEMARRTAHSCLERMALVPRVLEARGLDVTPAMIERLTALGDAPTVAILEVILREEVAHVAAGTRWFRHLCEREGREPRSTFRDLLRQHGRGFIRGPFNLDARRAAGFDDEELAGLEAAVAAAR